MSHWEGNPQSVEWYTPAWVFTKLALEFDFDPCPARYAAGHVPAKAKAEGNGLTTDWHGKVWLNPPYAGRGSLWPWLAKFVQHGNGIALVPDRTSAPWFQAVWEGAQLICFAPKIKFERPDGTLGASPSNGSAFLAIGDECVPALQQAAKAGLGILAVPLRQKAFA